MKPTSRQLAGRDPALAALMGALPGSDFGADWERRTSEITAEALKMAA